MIKRYGRYVFEFGEQFNRLTCLGDSIDNSYGKTRKSRSVPCLCQCGTFKLISVSKLVNGATKSCGCLAREVASVIRKNPKGVTALNTLISTYIKSAKDREYHFELSVQECDKLFTSNCYYCGTEPNQFLKRNPDYLYNGIDRVDNKYGYTTGNTVPCCGICNRMKSNLDLDVFINHVNKIKSHILNSSNYVKECENEVSRIS